MVEMYFAGISAKAYRNFVKGSNGEYVKGHYAPQVFRNPLDALEHAYEEASELVSRMVVLAYNFEYTRKGRHGIVVDPKFRGRYEKAFRETKDNGLDELVRKYVDKNERDRTLLDLAFKKRSLDKIIKRRMSESGVLNKS